MLNIETYSNPYLDVKEPDNINLNISLKNYLLFTQIEDNIVAVTNESHLSEASQYYFKIQSNYPLVILDEDSFDNLYNKSLEAKADKSITEMQENNNNGMEEESEEELSLTEFLRTSSDILTSEESAPIIKFVNALFYQAVKKKASDIHIEAHENKGDVRFRLDGVLVKNVDLDKNIINLVINRIKVISSLDIAEKRIPQDGRTQIKISGKTLDIRVSILPSFYGERVVMRILMQSDQIPSIDELGFNPNVMSDIKGLLNHSHGIILVTGPTGSGKTTSLHAFLQEVESSEKNLITVEDPVEYKSNNISQIQVNDKVGLTFAAAIRSILRQDPDIIMIGEIRDEETANIAIRAALTGHLVFSTLHTNSAAATISRLSDMGIEPFLISSAVLGILAQRLVRILCNHCKIEDALAIRHSQHIKALKNFSIYKAIGCKQCNFTGFIGRQSIGELLLMNDDIRDIIKVNIDELSLKKHLEKKGMQTISMQLVGLLQRGETSYDEAVRIGLTDD
jgi:general secretion pathway protein E